MLLETKDWNSDGEYLPNIEKGDSRYDYFLLIRIKPDGEKLMRGNKLLYSNILENGKASLEKIIRKAEWEFDIPGYVTQEDIKYVFQNSYILPQNSYLNGKTRMDAENYYIQAEDMRDMDELVKILKQ